MAEAEPPALDLAELSRRFEEALLGGERKFTRIEVAQRAGISIDRAERIWHALGFATVPDDEVAFTDGDVEAARLMVALEEDGFIEPAMESALARKLGQTQSRLASWQSAMFLTLLGESDLGAEDSLEVASLLLPAMERMQTYVWRRHLAAAAGRAIASTGDMSHGVRVVGFADVVGYTRLSRRLTEPELAELIERFEAMAAEVVATHGGRLIKSIGDEVLFVADEPARGAEIALALQEETERVGDMPQLRIGLAWRPGSPRRPDPAGCSPTASSAWPSTATRTSSYGDSAGSRSAAIPTSSRTPSNARNPRSKARDVVRSGTLCVVSEHSLTAPAPAVVVREVHEVTELARISADDPLVMWAAQGLRRSRAWRLGDAVAVAAPDISRRDRLAVRGPADDLAPLVAHVLAEVGTSYRPFGEEAVVRELAERVPGVEFVASFGWMDCETTPLTAGPVRWLGSDDRVTALLEVAALAEGNELLSVAADAWSARGVGFLAGVATAPAARGRGLSTVVCGFVTAELIARCGRVALMVDKGNESAISIYRRLGYTYRAVAAARATTAVRAARLGAC